MGHSVSALFSPYIIDGVKMDYTPAQMLDDCLDANDRKDGNPATDFDSIVDEIVEQVPGKTVYDTGKIMYWLESIMKAGSKVCVSPTAAPGSHTRRRIASAIIGTLWKKGHFTLEDLRVDASWLWDCAPLGNMAAFYFSAEAASRYLFDLGIRLGSYSFGKSQDGSEARFTVSAEKTEDGTADDEYDFFNDKDDRQMKYCWISDENKCGSVISEDPASWLIYIPFDTCEFRLGNSLLEKTAGSNGDKAPEILDPDYFIDCFEVVRELVEDGVIISGTAVGSGGLAAAVARLCGGHGMKADISGIERATGEYDVMRVLFSEVPGVLIQINDADYDYVDSQMLLQDIAYYPLGHPGTEEKLQFIHGRKGVSDILASLLQGNIPEDDQDA